MANKEDERVEDVEDEEDEDDVSSEESDVGEGEWASVCAHCRSLACVCACVYMCVQPSLHP